MSNKGLVHIYTGNGKGKTTTSVGLAVRARAAGFEILFVHFNKRRSDSIGEDKMLEKLGIQVKFFAQGHPAFTAEKDLAKVIQQHKIAMEFLNDVLSTQDYDMVVMDEILISVRDGFVQEQELLDLIKNRKEHIELVLTGRACTQAVIDAADLVSEIQEVKHPYNRGYAMRIGIER